MVGVSLFKCRERRSHELSTGCQSRLESDTNQLYSAQTHKARKNSVRDKTLTDCRATHTKNKYVVKLSNDTRRLNSRPVVCASGRRVPTISSPVSPFLPRSQRYRLWNRDLQRSCPRWTMDGPGTRGLRTSDIVVTVLATLRPGSVGSRCSGSGE